MYGIFLRVIGEHVLLRLDILVKPPIKWIITMKDSKRVPRGPENRLASEQNAILPKSWSTA